jgi:hypothetical protein
LAFLVTFGVRATDGDAGDVVNAPDVGLPHRPWARPAATDGRWNQFTWTTLSALAPALSPSWRVSG